MDTHLEPREPMPHERRRIFYRGRVQGVGFRMTTRRLARGFAVSGYVRNLDDGRVEIVAEGELGELDGFLDAVALEFGDHIVGIDVGAGPEGGEPLAGFTIRP